MSTPPAGAPGSSADPNPDAAGSTPNPSPRSSAGAAGSNATPPPAAPTALDAEAPLTRRAGHGLLLALTFLTVVPAPVPDDAEDGRELAPAFYGFVGALIGLVGAGVLAALEPAVGLLAAAIVAVLATTVLTGGLHQDGLADCADGLGVRGDRERRLAVMRDSAIGSFGTLALVFWALLLTTSLAQLGTGEAAGALVAAAALGRTAALLHALWAPPARTDGLGAAFAPSTSSVTASALTAIAAALITNLGAGGVAVLAAVLVAAALSAWSRRALGGRTGDTLGATVVLAELAAVLVVLAFH